jgi:hypothetical protein
MHSCQAHSAMAEQLPQPFFAVRQGYKPSGAQLARVRAWQLCICSAWRSVRGGAAI